MNVCGCCQVRLDYDCIDTFSRPMFLLVVSALALLILKKMGAFKAFKPIDVPAWAITRHEEIQRYRLQGIIVAAGCLFLGGIALCALECYSKPPCRRIPNELEVVD